MNTEIQNHLSSLHACDEATEWAEDYASIQEAWEACTRGDWLLWYAAKVGRDPKLVVQATCLCAREALQYVPAGEHRPLRAIETAEAWCRGEATSEEIQKAARAAYAAEAAAEAAIYAAVDAAARAWFAAYAAAARAAARAAAHAAHDAHDAVYDADATYAAAAADAAYFAAEAATEAAYAADPDSTQVAALTRSADLVRSVIGTVPEREVP